MVARSHQAFYFSQTCSLNMSGKIFDTMGSPEGGTFPRHVHQKYQFFYPLFLSNGSSVGVGVSRRLESQDKPLSRREVGIFWLRVRFSPQNFTTFLGDLSKF